MDTKEVGEQKFVETRGPGPGSSKGVSGGSGRRERRERAGERRYGVAGN